MSNLLKQYIRKSLKLFLGDEYDLLEDFFEVIRKDAADYIIFISRRCFVLYQLFAYIGNWKREHIISDRGIRTYREQIRQAGRIILADDILIWGSAMGATYELLNSVLNHGKKYDIRRVVYCRYAENNEKDVTDIHAFSIRSMRECRMLTNRLAKSIMVSGFPYTSFLYPFYGKNQGVEVCLNEDVVTFEKVEATESKWESFYVFKVNEKLQEMLECLSDGGCIRYYLKPDENLLCIIPFAFICDVKESYMSHFYRNIAQCCRESGWIEMAGEIERSEAEEDNEKWLYLPMLLSCLISRIMGVVEHVDKYFEGEYDREISQRSLAGLLSADIFKCLEEISEESCIRFVEQVCSRKDIWEVCLERLPKGDISAEHEGKDKCLNGLLEQFGQMRLKYEESRNPKDKKIDCSRLYQLYSDKFPRSIIQAAQIECYDVGIVTYGFEHDKAVGIVAKCGIGERSSLLFALKFAQLIHRYFVANSERENQVGVLTDSDRKNNLEEVLREAEITEEERKTFWSYIRNDVNNIYDYYLNY